VESEKDRLVKEKDAVHQDKTSLQQQLSRVEHEKQDLITEKSGNYYYYVYTVYTTI